jgi:hypothetical protein
MSLVPLLGCDRLSWASEMLDKIMFRHPDLRKLFESRFREIRLIDVANNHTHPTSACIRSSANDAMKDLAAAGGYKPYNVSCSRSDRSNGCRLYYFIKDLKIPYCEDVINENSCFIFTDVDYYADMNVWLRYGKPILIYTLVPLTVTHNDDETSWFFRDNVMHYTVSGGALYTHELWDYTGDTICVIDDDHNLLTFDVVQTAIDWDPNRRIIMILPVSKSAYPYWTFLDVNPGLKRKVVTRGKFNFIYNAHDDMLSIGLSGSNQSVQLKARLYEVIRKRLYCKSSAPTIADIERILNNSKHPEPVEAAALLFNNFLDEPLQPNIMPTYNVATFFQPTDPLVTEDGKSTGLIITSPLVTNPALFATRSFNSDYHCIKGRVTDVQNIVSPHDFRYRVWAEEFISCFIPDGTSLTPYGVEMVRQRQSNPSQRARYGYVEASMSTTSTNRLAAFVKLEPYGATNAPRNITTCSPELTTLMSGYTFIFKDELLLNCHWYGPGKSPLQICERLRAVVDNGSLQTDYSRFDGTISKFLQDNVVRAAYLRAFRNSYRVEMSNWITKVFIQKATTSSGQRYDPCYGTRSGSPITTDGNTMINAYIVFCSLRKIGFGVTEAYNKLGIYCGDDGVSSVVSGMEESINEVVNDFGLTIKTLVSDRNDPIVYCGRIFCNILVQNDSFQDPIRTIPKLHLSANVHCTPQQAAFNKASGYMVTDGNTPLISDWARKVISLCPGYEIVRPNHHDNYKLGSPWPQDDKDLIRDSFCDYMGLSSIELETKVNLLSAVTNLFEFPVIIDNVVEHKLSAVVGSEIIGASPSGLVPTPTVELLISNQNANQSTTVTNVPLRMGQRHNAKQYTTPRQRSEYQTRKVRQRRPGCAARRQGASRHTDGQTDRAVGSGNTNRPHR